MSTQTEIAYLLKINPMLTIEGAEHIITTLKNRIL